MKTEEPPEEHILIVENEPDHSTLMRRTLEGEGYRVIVVGNVESGIAQLRRLDPEHDHHFDFAVVIIDLSFAPSDEQRVDATGMEVFTESLKWPFLEAVIVTGHASLETAMKAANEGTFNYITKDGDLAGQLVKAVNTAVAVRRTNLGMENLLSKSYGICASLRATGADSTLVNSLQDEMRKMRQTFWAMQRSRGKKPPPRMPPS
jgi:two-component system nitrogen regulation response regulator NtrX